MNVGGSTCPPAGRKRSVAALLVQPARVPLDLSKAAFDVDVAKPGELFIDFVSHPNREP
jgi:hypothetical protein